MYAFSKYAFLLVFILFIYFTETSDYKKEVIPNKFYDKFRASLSMIFINKPQKI